MRIRYHFENLSRKENSIPEVHENPTFQDEDSFESVSDDSILNHPVAPPPIPSLPSLGRPRPVPIPRLAQTNHRSSSSQSAGNVYTLEPTDFRNLNGKYIRSTSDQTSGLKRRTFLIKYIK